MIRLLIFMTAVALLTSFVVSDDNKEEGGWKAGVAKIEITPTFSMWLAGYAAREEPSEGELHPLWAKALALEDQEGNRAVLVTLDLVGLPKPISDQVRDSLFVRLALDRSQIILNCSHTHSGPVLNEALLDIYPLDAAELQKIDRYSHQLIEQMVELVSKAFETIEPVRLFSGNGVARFQVNRRNNLEQSLIRQHELQGPNDYAVPVLKVTTQQDSLLAIAFGYACHPTVLDTNLWSGDYPGFAQNDTRKALSRHDRNVFSRCWGGSKPITTPNDSPGPAIWPYFGSSSRASSR